MAILEGSLRPLLLLAATTWVVACASALAPDREPTTEASGDIAREAMAFCGAALTTRLYFDHFQSRFQAAAFIAAATGLEIARRRGAVRSLWRWSARVGGAVLGIALAHFITDGF